MQSATRMSWIFISFISLIKSVAAANTANVPTLSFDLLRIKTPQLIGIAAGCLVFATTIGVVIYLLYMSGSLSKLLVELQSNQPLTLKKEVDTSPQFSEMPELYDHLIKATTVLKLKPTMDTLKGKLVDVKVYNSSSDGKVLFNACNGTATCGESAYDPARIWGWLDSNGLQKTVITSNDKTFSEWPCVSEAAFNRVYDTDVTVVPNSNHFSIIDKELSLQIGMFSLVDNDPRNLSIRIDNLWITPAFQGKKRAHDAVLQVLTWLVDNGYRRITAEIDERHIIGRKFLEKCGFQLEAVLRKHKVVQRRNRNTALYVVLNSDWIEVETKLKRHLGYSLKPLTHKVAEIEVPKTVSTTSTAGAGTGGSNTKKDKKTATTSDKQNKKKK